MSLEGHGRGPGPAWSLAKGAGFLSPADVAGPWAWPSVPSQTGTAKVSLPIAPGHEGPATLARSMGPARLCLNGWSGWYTGTKINCAAPSNKQQKASPPHKYKLMIRLTSLVLGLLGSFQTSLIQKHINVCFLTSVWQNTFLSRLRYCAH